MFSLSYYRDQQQLLILLLIKLIKYNAEQNNDCKIKVILYIVKKD